MMQFAGRVLCFVNDYVLPCVVFACVCLLVANVCAACWPASRLFVCQCACHFVRVWCSRIPAGRLCAATLYFCVPALLPFVCLSLCLYVLLACALVCLCAVCSPISVHVFCCFYTSACDVGAPACGLFFWRCVVILLFACLFLSLHACCELACLRVCCVYLVVCVCVYVCVCVCVQFACPFACMRVFARVRCAGLYLCFVALA